MDRFSVVDQAAKTRYEGRSLRVAYDIWLQLATVHAAYMTDEQGDRIMDADCGGGNTLFWDRGEDDALILFDTACGLNACWDCDDHPDKLGHGYDDNDMCEICGDMYEDHGHVDTHPFVGGLLELGAWQGR